jgi:poly(hydroxyalkanoate) depolymerase family esterase
MNPKLLLAALVCASSIASAPRPAAAGELIEGTFDAKGYPGSKKRQYRIFVPGAYDARVPAAMLMVLHGCKQTSQNMIDETGFNALAERDRFIVVYPFVTSYDGRRSENCWGFWFDQEIHAGAGEVEDLYQLAREVEGRYAIDPQRRYVTGLSSGGGMAVALAVARSEYFAAAGAAAGLAYGESSWSVGFSCLVGGFFESVSSSVASMRGEQTASADQRPIPIMTVQSRNDCTVNPRGAENIRDAWLQRYGVSTIPYDSVDCSNEGVRCARQKYGSAQHSLVETVFYEGAAGGFTGRGSHYWVGDNSGEYANPTGPSASALFWDFFQQHRFDESPATAGVP